MNSSPSLPLEQRIGLFAWAALALLQIAWHAWWFPPQTLSIWLVLTITVIPLLPPMLAIRHPRRALLWVGILSLFYFCHGVAEAWSAAGQRWLALIEIILAVLLIGTLGAGVKRKPNLS